MVETTPSDPTVFDLQSLQEDKNPHVPEGTPIKDDMRPLVLYTYTKSPNARVNLEFLIAKGIYGAIDFILLSF